MKSRIVVLVVLLAVDWFGEVLAQSWVENQNTITRGEVSPQIDGLLFSNLSSQFGGYCWFQVNENWAQACAGPTLSPSSWSQVGVAVGLEQNDDPLRYACFLWLGKGRWSLVAIGEGGGSGYWHKLETNFRVSKLFGTGTITQRFLGVGMRVEFNPLPQLKIWGGFLRDGNNTNELVGVRFIN